MRAAAIGCSGIVSLGAFAACSYGASPHVRMTPIAGVREVEVYDNRGELAARIVDRKEVAAIAAFVNGRRGDWYEPPLGDLFATSGGLQLRDSRKTELARIEFGEGGMIQTRPNLTDRSNGDIEPRFFFRTPDDSDERQRDEATLCTILGKRLASMSCFFEGEPGAAVHPEDNRPCSCPAPLPTPSAVPRVRPVR